MAKGLVDEHAGELRVVENPGDFMAKRASLVQSRIKAIDKLGDIQMMDRDPEYVFNFPFPDASIPASIVSFNDVSFHYPNGPELFKKLSFGIDLETRAAIVGPNGTSPWLPIFKSTQAGPAHPGSVLCLMRQWQKCSRAAPITRGLQDVCNAWSYAPPSWPSPHEYTACCHL